MVTKVRVTRTETEYSFQFFALQLLEVLLVSTIRRWEDNGNRMIVHTTLVPSAAWFTHSISKTCNYVLHDKQNLNCSFTMFGILTIKTIWTMDSCFFYFSTSFYLILLYLGKRSRPNISKKINKIMKNAREDGILFIEYT